MSEQRCDLLSIVLCCLPRWVTGGRMLPVSSSIRMNHTIFSRVPSSTERPCKEEKICDTSC